MLIGRQQMVDLYYDNRLEWLSYLMVQYLVQETIIQRDLTKKKKCVYVAYRIGGNNTENSLKYEHLLGMLIVMLQFWIQTH